MLGELLNSGSVNITWRHAIVIYKGVTASRTQYSVLNTQILIDIMEV